MTQRGPRAEAASQRVIDLAVGILMGLRGCSAREAFDDLVDAVHRTGKSPTVLATALVGLVEGAGDGVPHQSDAALVWGHLLVGRRTTETGIRHGELRAALP